MLLFYEFDTCDAAKTFRDRLNGSRPSGSGFWIAFRAAGETGDVWIVAWRE